MQSRNFQNGKFFVSSSPNAGENGSEAPLMADKSRRLGEYFFLAGNIFRWDFLYSQMPPDDSFAWKFYPDRGLWHTMVTRWVADNSETGNGDPRRTVLDAIRFVTTAAQSRQWISLDDIRRKYG
jgi:hypothetical protein